MLKDLAARMKHAYGEVTHAVRAITGETVVMNLYQMVLYVKAIKVLDRLQCNTMSDKKCSVFIFW